MFDPKASPKLIFEQNNPAPKTPSIDLPELDVPEASIDESLLAENLLDLPEVGQLDVVRHYTALAKRNFSVDANFYPLGSCTMKFNPSINEAAAAMEGFIGVHPSQDDQDAQGVLKMLHESQT